MCRQGGCLAEQIQIWHGHAIAGFSHEEVGQRGFDLQPGHTRRQNSQWVAQVDHVVDTAAKEVIGGGAGKHGQNSQKMAIKLGEIIPRKHEITQLNQWIMNKSGPTK